VTRGKSGHRDRKSRRSGTSQPEDRINSWFAGTAPALLKKMGDPKERLRWLIEDFARRRTYAESDRAPEAVVREVAVFLIYQNEPGTLYLGRAPRLPANVLQDLSSGIEKSVNQFLDGEDWIIPIWSTPGLQSTPAMSRCIRRSTVELGREKGKSTVVPSWRGSSMQTRAPDFALIFRLAAQDLVASEHHYLAKCAGCQMVFVRDDLRQTFCTVRCSATARTRRHRVKRLTAAPSKQHGRRLGSNQQKKMGKLDR
jgi:hypothetical protein